LHPIPFLSVTW